MLIKKTLTAVAVDSARDYVKERLEDLKKLDLDKDGVKDVDQIMAVVTRVGEKLKDSIESTDFPKLATGVEHVFTGLGLIGESVDRKKLAATCDDLARLYSTGQAFKARRRRVKESRKVESNLEQVLGNLKQVLEWSTSQFIARIAGSKPWLHAQVR